MTAPSGEQVEFTSADQRASVTEVGAGLRALPGVASWSTAASARAELFAFHSGKAE